MKKFTVSFVCVFALLLIAFFAASEVTGTSSKYAANADYMKSENLALRADETKINDANNNTAYRFSKRNGAEIVLDLGETVEFNSVILKEKGLNIQEFVLSASTDGESYTDFYKNDKIEFHRLCSFEEVEARYVKLTVVKSDAVPKIREFEIYNEVAEKNTDFRVTAYSTLGTEIYSVIDDSSVPEDEKDAKIQNMINADYFDTVTDYIQIGNVSWDENGNVATLGWDGIKYDEEKYYGRMMKNLHAVLDPSGVNLVVTILNPTGEGGNEKVMRSITENRDTLISNMISFANKYQIDGIDLDWEFPMSQEEFDAYNSFLQELKSRMDSEMWNKDESTLSLAVATWALKYTPETIKCIDYVNVMGYDILDQDGQHSSFFSSCVQAADYIESQGFSKEQIMVGVPFYGTYVKGNMEQYLYKNINYDDITPYNNYYTMQHYETGEDRYTYFNSQAIIRDKTAYAYYKGYGGVMIFSLYCDVASTDSKSLTKSISEFLQEAEK